MWFQSIAGSDAANETFDIDTGKMLAYAAARTGPYGLYFETGQGADFTNGHDHGFDMVLHESRKYGFARALAAQVAEIDARGNSQPWVHLNDVAGFIGPEVFRARAHRPAVHAAGAPDQPVRRPAAEAGLEAGRCLSWPGSPPAAAPAPGAS